MKLVFLIGGAAVGKMTVGQELAKITGLRLLHDHVSVEPVIEVFGCPNTNVSMSIQEAVFQEFAASDNYGLIFTYLWDFDSPKDWGYIEHIRDIFLPYGTTFYFVELVAPQSVRLQRNATENRLRNKASLNNIARSAEQILREDGRHRYVSEEGELKFEHYIRIDNTNMPPEEAARRIREEFQL